MQRIAVIGAGTMGAGIALSAAIANFDVDLIEVDPTMRERTSERLKRDANRLNRPDALARIQMCSAIAQLGDDELAIEAVPEDLSLKQRVFAELEKKLRGDAIFATNTSSLSVAQIAAALANPGRLIGLHFFNPPTMMQLVEVVHAEHASDAVIEIGRAFTQALGKTAVIAADTPGFIVNRIARPYYVQAMRAFDRCAGSLEDLDLLARSAGFRMGPFELMDLIGLDINLATTESIYERTQAARFEPVPLQQQMVAQGKLGRKTGEGFYKYEGDGSLKREPIVPPDAPEKDDEEGVLVIGFGAIADTISSALRETYANVQQIETDDALDELEDEPTIVFDIGDGVSDRSAALVAIEQIVAEDAVIFIDAYATPMRGITQRLKNPKFLVGYGIVGALERQAIVEIVDADVTDDDALVVAEEVFAALGKRTMLVQEIPGLFLGRVIGSIVNEAVYAIQEGVAAADDIDVAMCLGTNYPLGPIAWGREIGGERVARILSLLAEVEGTEFGPARALWALDAEAQAIEQMAEDQVRHHQRAYGAEL